MGAQEQTGQCRHSHSSLCHQGPAAAPLLPTLPALLSIPIDPSLPTAPLFLLLALPSHADRKESSSWSTDASMQECMETKDWGSIFPRWVSREDVIPHP